MALNLKAVNTKKEKDKEKAASISLPSTSRDSTDSATETAFYSRMSQLSKKLSDKGYNPGTPNVLTSSDIIAGKQNQSYQTSQPRISRILSDQAEERENNRLSKFGSGNLSTGGSMPQFGASADEWVRGASGTLANSTLFSIPHVINQGLNLAFDWLQNGGENIANALGVNLGDYRGAVESARNIFAPEDDVLEGIYKANENQAASVRTRSPSAEAVYPLIGTLGQIATTAGTAGAGAAAGLSSNATRGAMAAADFARNLGEGYTSRREEGQNFDEALVRGVLEAAPTTAIEFAGGVENLLDDAVRGGISGVSGWAERATQSAIEEALEEIAQDPLGSLADALTGKDVPILASDLYDPNSEGIINIRRALDSAGYAMLGSLIAGGAGAGIDAVENRGQIVDNVRNWNENRRQQRQQQAAERAQNQVTQQSPEDVALRMARGENVAATENAIRVQENTRENQIENFADSLGENGAKAYRQTAPRNSTEAEAQGFRNSFEAYYRWGTYGQDFDSIDSAFKSYITEPEARQAYYAGQNDAEMAAASAAENVSPEVSTVGLTPTEAANSVDNNTRQYLDEVARALGVEIQIENAPTDQNGRALFNGRVDGNTIYLSANSENNLAGVLNHELTHVLQQRNAEEYRQYRDLVAGYLDKTDPGFMTSEIDRIVNGYAEQGQTISREDAIDDIVADAADRFLADPSAAASTVQTNKPLARRILDAIRDIISRLGKIVRGDSGQTRASQMLQESAETYERAEKIWTAALAESAPEQTNIQTKKKTKRSGTTSTKTDQARKQLADDIYSDEDVDLDSLNREVAEVLRAGDDEVNAEVSALRAQAKILQNATISKETVDRTVDKLTKEYGANDTEQANRLKSVVNDAVRVVNLRGESGFNEALSAIYGAARDTVGVSEYLDDSVYTDPAVVQVRDLLKNTRMYVSPEIRSSWTDWNNFRKKNTGRLRLVNSSIYTDSKGVSHSVRGVDQIYMELNEMAPEFFPDDIISPEDQLNAMSDFWDAIQPTYIKRFNEAKTGVTLEQAEAAMDLTTDILSSIGAQSNYSGLSDLEQQVMRGKLKAYEKANRELTRKYLQRSKALERQKERTQKKVQAERDKRKERVSQVREEWRERSAERVQRVRERNRESRQKASEKRAASAYRVRISKVAARLTKKLERPSDTQHIPEELRGVVSDFLKTLDFSSTEARNEKAGGATKKTLAWRALYERLDTISQNAERGNTDQFYASLDPDLLPRLKKLLDPETSQKIADLNASELSELYKVVRAVEKGIIEVDNIRINGQQESATETARGIIEDTRKSWKEQGGGKLRRRISQFFKWDLMDPTRFSDLYGPRFKSVFEEVRNAENVKINHWEEVEQFFTKLKQDMGFTDKDLRRLENEYIDVRFTNRAKPVKMSRAQVMSLYLTDKREQGRKHLYSADPSQPGGGFTLTDSNGKEIRTSYRTTPEEVKAITDRLTTQEKALADEMQKFAANIMARWGNEASRAVYGYNKFTEKNYWPVSADPNWTRREASVDGNQQDATIKSSGFTKALQDNASNPLVIDSVFNVFSKHATQMAAYGAYLEPLESMNKVINWNTRKRGNLRSVREVMTMTHGEEGVRYLNELLRDINGQGRTDPQTPWEALLGKAKGASVAANIRVVVQQPTAIQRASALIPEKYILMGLVGKTNTEEFFNEIPIARWKSWGYFRDGVNGSNIKELLIGKEKAVDRALDKAMAAAGAADNITWKALYRATQHWVKGTTDLQGEAYRQEVQKRFMEVIDRTQVMDSIFQRTPAMRRKGMGWKLITAFMSEPLKSYNLLVGSARDITNAAAGKQKGAKKQFVRATAAFASSALLNALIVSLIDVGRDDDDGEEFMDKYGQALLGDSLWNGVIKGEEDVSGFDLAIGTLEGNLAQNLNPLGLVPVVKDIISMIEGYDYELMGVSAVSDVIDAARTMITSYQNADSSKTILNATSNFFLKLSTVTGLPINNIIRDGKALFNYATMFSEIDGTEDALKAKFSVYKLTLKPGKNKADYISLLREAQVNGYDTTAKEIRDYLISQGGMTRDQIQSQLLSLVLNEEENLPLLEEYAAAYNAGDVSKMESLVDKAAAAHIDGETLMDAAKKLNSSVVSGYSDAMMSGDQETADEIKAQAERIGVPISDLEEAASEDAAAEEARGEEVGSDLYTEATYSTSYLYDSLINAMLDGDGQNESTIRTMLSQAGETEEDINSKIQSGIKSAMAEAMGYNSLEEMEDDGAMFDPDSDGYQILHDDFGYTQYHYSDLADAFVNGNDRQYQDMVEDMVGQTSSGDSVYTEEKIEKNLKSDIQTEFNKCYEWGRGTGWEKYRDALKRLGKSWDDILSSYKRSSYSD